ncbi:MAG: DUF1549 domain-containing protein [Acidobacteria bacterium]|nr:DUF1549 domain-containing protein [Acidobacteriota bacterium]MBI3427126.1 DUF1549 domain-containing protein [Acidobacteriota bacterium]
MFPARHRLKLLALLLTGWFGWQTLPPSAAQSTQRRLDFNRDIRPILSDKCFACHGPDATAKRIKLRLDSEAAAKADLGGHRAIVPGDTTRSELVRRITAADEAERMPPSHAPHQLTAQEIETLTEWVKQGAPWQQHWAFIPPARPAWPAVKNRAWVRNAIDAFVLARLEKEGLQPSPEADRATLLRRVSLDLTGLPPTLAELDDFLNDSSPNAYEKVVDRLLASPRYGERMAFKWLDAARYADTNGYQIDGDRSAWRWRDWVIAAFNANMPYDQFITEQLAGDLLPNPTLEQRIATAFNRNHRLNAEGGIVPEEYRVEYVVDRVDTTATVLLGLTLGCARCHNHKFDPFTQKEYYQFSAFFNSIDEDGHSFDQGNSPPWLAAPTRAQQQQLAALEREIAQTEKQLAALEPQAAAQQRRWERTLSNSQQQWFSHDKLIVRIPLDENTAPTFNPSDRAYHDQYDKRKEDPPLNFPVEFKNGAPRYVPAPTGQGVAFDGKLYFDAGIHADFRYKSTSKDYRERFSIAAWVYPESEQSGSILTKVSDAPAEVEDGVPRADGYGLYFLNGKLHFNMVFRWGEDALRVETADTLPLKQWQHVAVVFDGTQAWEDRLRIYVNGQPRKLTFTQRNFFLLFGGSKNTLKLGAGGGPQFRFKGALDEVRLYSRPLEPAEIAILACADSLETIAALRPAQRTPAQAAKLRGAFLDGLSSDNGSTEMPAKADVRRKAAGQPQQSLRVLAEKLRTLKQRKFALEETFPNLMVMAEMPTPRPAYLLKRGAYDAPGEQVERLIPAVLTPWQKEWPNNRLGLAKWLTSPAHPLTSRVAVNRLWQMLFGVGFVKTVEDFGAQGELPSHPELLDWLAVEFSEGGTGGVRDASDFKSQIPNLKSARWDIKALLKTIVMSATYRQSSKRPEPKNPQSSTLPGRNPQSLDDPENRLLARGPRLRLSADIIRDQALFAAGLLVEQVGGPSVKPYQPDGLYKDMAFSGLTGYERDQGAGLWRRSLYTFWKRTVLSPTMQVFDASAREFCTVRDTRTNTPLQSLNLMNDVTYVEAARFLAERMLKEGDATPEQRLAWGFRVLTARQPSAGELQVLLRDLNKQQEHFSRNSPAAAQLLAVGDKRSDAKLNAVELAAYATTASLLFNLDEVITKQ